MRHWATTLEVAVSIPDAVAGIDLIIPDSLWPWNQFRH